MVTAILSVVGVVVGAVLTKVWDILAVRRAARVRLLEAQNACRNRLKNIAVAAAAGGTASTVNASEIVSQEIWHLGAAFDLYWPATVDPAVRSMVDPTLEDQVRKVLLLHEVEAASTAVH